MLLIDPDNDDIKDANRAACRFYGYGHDEITGVKITDIEFTAAPSRRRGSSDEKRKQEEHFPYKHKSADGEIRNVEVFKTPMAIGNKKLLYAIVHDVTDKTHAERTIQTLVESTVRGIGQDYILWLTFVPGINRPE